jgi:hypothetical protein
MHLVEPRSSKAIGACGFLPVASERRRCVVSPLLQRNDFIVKPDRF